MEHDYTYNHLLRERGREKQRNGKKKEKMLLVFSEGFSFIHSFIL